MFRLAVNRKDEKTRNKINFKKTKTFKIGENTADPLQMYLADVLTIAANLAGVCGINVPCGYDNDNLPIGLQLIGPAFGEETILRAAHAYEQSTEWHKRYPELG
mgnify:CR=1 FL=1